MQSLWTWLITPPGVADVLDPFGLVCVTIFSIGFLASAYLAGPGGSNLAHHMLHIEAIHHWSTVGLWIFGAGLFFFAVRALQINPLSFGAPIWLLVSFIALIVAAVRFADWWGKNRPARADIHPLDTSPPVSHPARQQHPPLPSRWERGAGG